ncbi:MAG: hypothetical protein ACHQSE_01635 [Gemmatimonadales bacterium]
MNALRRPEEIRLESERRLAISTVTIILGLDLAVMILDLRSAGPGLTSVPPVIAIRLFGVLLAAIVTGALSAAKTRRALELTIFFAAVVVVAIVVSIRSISPVNDLHAFAFDLVYIATLFVALPTRPALQLVPVTLVCAAAAVRIFDFGRPMDTGDRVYFAIMYLAAVGIGFLATVRRHELGRNLSAARKAEVEAAKDAERANRELQTLRGIIPICSHCHRVRIEDGRLWEAVDMYVSRRTDAAFSHGVCPDCLVEHYPNVRAG